MPSRRRRWTRIAAYVLLTDEDRMLVCRLSPRDNNAVGRYTLPGGGLEFGEAPEAAAIREAQEETGYDVEITDLVAVDSHVYEFPDGEMHALQFIYRARIVGGELRNEPWGSTDLCEWVHRDAVLELPIVSLVERGLQLAFE